MLDETRDWARENFANARLGDPRRVDRLVSIAEQAARTPAGKVTEVFKSSAEREGAFRLLENDSVRSESVADAVFDATAVRAAELKRMYVAVDATSLTLTDRAHRRDLGRVGKRWPTRGLHVMTALGLDEHGVPIGLLDQRWWAQTKPPKPKRAKSYGSKYQERETRFWLQTLENVQERLGEHAPDATPWFQLDRGADCWPLLSLAVEQKLLVTVRACHNRRLVDRKGRRQYLRETLKKQPVLGYFDCELPERPDRPARTARIALRATPVVILARVAGKKWREIAINAVLAEELSYRGKDRLQWFLLTTAAVSTFETARAVVHGYRLRWRIEEFHRLWKRGYCRVEESQLQSRSALTKWGTILAAVAARALRIAQLLRETPDIPASDEFSRYEVAAIFALADKKLEQGRAPSFKEVVDLLADLGGFAHKYSGGKPGPTIIGRALTTISPIATALKNLDEMR